MENSNKKLYRSSDDRIIAGVCGGLGKYFDIDPIIFRILFVVFTFANGFGVLLYIILVAIIPKEGTLASSGDTQDKIKQAADNLSQEAQELATRIKGNKNVFQSRRNIIGLVIVVIGLLALVNNFLPMRWFNLQFIAIIGMIALGLYIMLRK